MNNIIFDVDGTLVDSSVELPFFIEMKKHVYNSKEYREARKVLMQKSNLSILYNGFNEVFDYIRENQIKTAIVTNSSKGRVSKFIDRFKIPITNSAFIHRFYFNRFGSIKKPNPKPLQTAIQLIGANTSNTLMVGNEVDDIKAAQRCGCKSVVCKWGVLKEQWEEIQELKPNYIIDNPIELIDIIAA